MDYRGRILRIIDANINRAKEGLRVCEDIMRLIIDDKNNTQLLKKIRHEISKIISSSKICGYDILKYRDSLSDVGRKIKTKNLKKIIYDVFSANSQRVKEALRVLEELFCIFDSAASLKLQNLRFKFYNVEKESLKKIRHLCSDRHLNLPKKYL